MRRAVEPGFKYVYVNQDGSVRELSPAERAYLSQEFSGGDSGRPYVKSGHESRDGWGSLSGFIERRNHHATPDRTSEYSLSVDEVAEEFRAAGFSFSERAASRWYRKGRLDCILVPVERGRIEKYFAAPESVSAEIEKMRRPNYSDLARRDATEQAAGKLRKSPV